jgi:hypothetical protein
MRRILVAAAALLLAPLALSQSFLLQENLDLLQQENGDGILLEAPPEVDYAGFGKIRRMYILPSNAGQVFWSTCTPVAEVTPGPGKVGTFDDDGALPIQRITSTAGKVAGVDYEVACAVPAAAGKRWRTDDDGYLAITVVATE